MGKGALHQRGMTLPGIAVLVAVVAFFFLLTVRLLPVYLESYKVDSSLESLGNENIANLSDNEVKDLLLRRLKINDVSRVDSNNIVVRRSANQVVVSVRYEARVPILGNVDAVASFDKTETVGR